MFIEQRYTIWHATSSNNNIRVAGIVCHKVQKLKIMKIIQQKKKKNKQLPAHSRMASVAEVSSLLSRISASFVCRPLHSTIHWAIRHTRGTCSPCLCHNSHIQPFTEPFLILAVRVLHVYVTIHTFSHSLSHSSYSRYVFSMSMLQFTHSAIHWAIRHTRGTCSPCLCHNSHIQPFTEPFLILAVRVLHVYVTIHTFSHSLSHSSYSHYWWL